MKVFDQPKQTSTAELLRLLRSWHPTAEERIDLFAGLATNIQTAQCGLSQGTRKTIVDLLDSATMAIDDETANNAAEIDFYNQRNKARYETHN